MYSEDLKDSGLWGGDTMMWYQEPRPSVQSVENLGSRIEPSGLHDPAQEYAQHTGSSWLSLGPWCLSHKTKNLCNL